MSEFRFRDGEPVGEGARRIAAGRLDHALAALAGEGVESAEEGVHEARKDTKKLRSLLRLLRSEFEGEDRRAQNARLREAAGALSGVRDADVMTGTLDALAEELPAAVVSGLRDRLEAHRRELEGSRGVDATAEVETELREARAAVAEWRLERDSWEAVEPGLLRSYRRGRRGLARALETPSTENLHEWRKRVKDLWYHLTLLRATWPEPLDAAGDEAHRLSDLLGEDHDLAVLEEFAGGDEEVGAVVRARRRELQQRAFVLGLRLYAERPKAFAARMGAYWLASK